MSLLLTSTRYSRRVYVASGPVVTLQLVPLPSRTPFSLPVPPRRERGGGREGAQTPHLPPSSRSSPFRRPLSLSLSRPRHDQYYAPELRHPNRPRDGLLLPAKHPWAARWCNFRLETFPARETGNQNEKLKAGRSVGRLDHAEESRCEVSLGLYPLTLPEGAGMESIIVPVIALLAWAVIRNRRDWFRGLDKCRGQVRSGFYDYERERSFSSLPDSFFFLFNIVVSINFNRVASCWKFPKFYSKIEEMIFSLIAKKSFVFLQVTKERTVLISSSNSKCHFLCISRN